MLYIVSIQHLHSSVFLLNKFHFQGANNDEDLSYILKFKQQQVVNSSSQTNDILGVLFRSPPR